MVKEEEDLIHWVVGPNPFCGYPYIWGLSSACLSGFVGKQYQNAKSAKITLPYYLSDLNSLYKEIPLKYHQPDLLWKYCIKYLREVSFKAQKERNRQATATFPRGFSPPSKLRVHVILSLSLPTIGNSIALSLPVFQLTCGATWECNSDQTSCKWTPPSTGLPPSGTTWTRSSTRSLPPPRRIPSRSQMSSRLMPNLASNPTEACTRASSLL